MTGPELLRSLLPIGDGLWAYGPVPGVEFIPYFLGLAAWAGLAFLAVLLSPFSALLRRLRGTKSAPPPEEANRQR